MLFFMLCGFIACAGMPVSSSCANEVSPERAAVRFGDPFSANCTSLSHQIDGMGWESTAGGIGFTPGVTSLPLTINSVRHWKLESSCFISYNMGQQCERAIKVTVYKTPDLVFMSQPSQRSPMAEGTEYRVQCDVVNVAPVRNLSVSWYKGNELVYFETFENLIKSPVNKSSVINLTAHRDDNGAKIWCEAKLNFDLPGSNLPSVQSNSHEVTVLYPPTFAKPETEVLELPAGAEITLDCTAAGNPAPEYSWHLPHSIQQTDKNQKTNQPILIPSFQLTGTYNCTAFNTQGTKTKYFTVIEAKSSRPGTTAGILMAVFFVFIFILGCVVYRKQRNSNVAGPEGDRTTFAALVGVLGPLGALFLLGGPFFVTPDGTFSFSKGSYLRGRPTSSGPV